jgi:hypothetical protein
MSSIYYFENNPINQSWALGQLLHLGYACYINGRALGYDEIYVEWKDNNSYLWKENGTKLGDILCPKNTVLPVKYLPQGDRPNSDKYIDIGKPNSLYDGCPPIFRSNKYILEYFKRFCSENKEYPFMEPIKDKSKCPYILFHYRKSEQQRQQYRNLPDEWYIDILNKLKELYGEKFKYYKIGEKSEFDNIFDKVYGYFPRNIDNMFKLIVNSELYIGSSSGPVSIPISTRHPMIILVKNTKKELEESFFYLDNKIQFVVNPCETDIESII